MPQQGLHDIARSARCARGAQAGQCGATHSLKDMTSAPTIDAQLPNVMMFFTTGPSILPLTDTMLAICRAGPGVRYRTRWAGAGWGRSSWVWREAGRSGGASQPRSGS